MNNLNTLVRSLLQNIYKRTPASLLLFILSFGPCDESLPPYQEPARVFGGQIAGSYALTVADNSMKIFFTIWNNFDETFQGPANLKGSVEIVSLRDPAVRKTFSVGPPDVIQSRGYDRNTGVLTIDARDSIRFMLSWDLTDDNGIDLRTSFFHYVVDNACEVRCLAFREDFTLTGHITLYDRTGPVYAGPTAYAFCFVSNWVNPRTCPPIITSAPCNFRPPQQARTCFPTYFGP